MSCKGPNLINLLTRTPQLIDKFAICRALTQDLQFYKYTAPENPEISISSGDEEPPKQPKSKPSSSRPSTSSSTAPPLSQKSKRKRGSSAESSTRVSPRKTLKELENESDIDEEMAQAGFADESGETVYLIEKVIRYDPKMGYFVHWQGFGKKDRTWQAPEDMPEAFTREMKRAREKYYSFQQR